MKKNQFYGMLLLCLFISVLNKPIKAQNVYNELFWEDYTPAETPKGDHSDNNSLNGGIFTPTGTLRCMIIYAGLIVPGGFNDNYDFKGDWPADDGSNTHTTVPKFVDGELYKLILQNETDIPNYNHVKNISTYYNAMSHGKFNIIGDVFRDPTTNAPVRINVDPTGCTGWSCINRKVIEKGAQLYPDFDWSPYDQRRTKVASSAYRTNNDAYDPDNVVDYVIIVYRYKNDPGNEPVAGMSQWNGSKGGISTADIAGLYWNGYRFSAGFTSPLSGNKPESFLAMFAHEFAHELYEAPHNMSANSTMGNHFGKPSNGWGMVGNSHTLSTANAWESWLLGWIDLKTGSGQVNADIQNASDLNSTGEYTLRDFVSTGDAIRVKIPNTDNTFLWIENHQKKTIFDHMPWAGKQPSKGAGSLELVANIEPGLYMYVENVWPTRENFNLSVSMPYTNKIQILNAQGNYEYTRTPYPMMDGNKIHDSYYWGNTVYTWTRGTKTNIGGVNPWYEVVDDYPKFNRQTKEMIEEEDGEIDWSNNINSGSVERSPIIRETNGINTNMLYGHLYGINNEARNNFGRRSDAFIINDKVGLSGIVPVLNYPEYNLVEERIEEIYLNGISVEVIDQYYDQMTVKIKYNDYTLSGNKRWTGYISLPNLTANDNYDLLLESNSTLTIDKSIIPNRHTVLNGEFVNPSVFTCMENSDLYLGYNASLNINNQSTFVLESDAKLSLYNYSNLNLANGSKMLVNDGAEIVVNIGAEINVDGTSSLVFESGNYTITNNGLLTLSSPIELRSNAHLTIKGSGCTKLYEAVLAEPGSTITFEGTNRNTKLIEVNGLVKFDSDFNHVKLINGKIQMNNSSSELFVMNGVDNVTIDNIWVSSLNGYNNDHMGIDIRSTGLVSINNSIFEYGEQGLYLYRAAFTTAVSVTNSTFRNNNMGLYAYNGSIYMNNCSFYGNTLRALICQSMDNYSLIKNSNFTDNSGATGIYYTGSSGTSLDVEGCTVDNNKYGILCYGPFSFDMYCSSSTNNDYYGVQAYNNARLNIDYSSLYGNKYAIQGHGSSSSNRYNLFYLDEGYNDLRDNGSSGSYSMYGYFYGYSSGTVSADNNYWKSLGGAPIRNIDYNLYGSSYYLTLSDNSPNSYKPSCTVSKSGNINALKNENAEIEEEKSYRAVVLSIGTMPMDIAFEAIKNKDASVGAVHEPAEKYGLLTELLLNDLTDPNNDEAALIERIYGNFKKQLGKLSPKERTNSSAIKKALKTMSKLQKEIPPGKDKDLIAARFKSIIDLAGVYLLDEQYDEAIRQIEKAPKKLENDDLCFLQEFICRIEAEKEMALNNSEGDIEELLARCQCDTTSNKSAEIAGSINSISETELKIIPNPITSNSEIIIKGYEGAEVNVYNSLGQKVLSATVDSDNFKQSINKNDFTEGVYMVTVSVNGKPVQNQKIVVVK